ncbi:GatB/YqeY domain-containing protein [Sphingomonadaceae bacterium]|nr:GatB/YqeY domain-containing protein [Sphingomonadaceae bacterium]
MLRDNIKKETILAMKGGEKERLATLRLISAKVKDRDIEARTGKAPADDDVLVTEVLQKMAKQRRESITMFDDGGRTELAEKERGELAVIEEFLPTMLDDEATRAAIVKAKEAVGAESIKDMGKVMAELKSGYGAELDMSRASALVKESLS